MTPPALATAIALLALVPALASAQLAAEPPPSGLYEGYSPITRAPYGPLTAAPVQHLSRWLEVKTSGRTSTLTFMPAASQIWTLAYGPHGLVSKSVEVRGQPHTVASFTYDGTGAPLAKAVTGLDAPLAWRYRTDGIGRVVERVPVVPDRGADLPGRVRMRFTYGDRGTLLDWTLGDTRIRRDHFDPAGRRLRTIFGDGRAPALTLRYRRDASGALRGVERRVDRLHGPVVFDRPVAGASPTVLALLAESVAERHEVLMLLGSPRRSSTARSKTQRTTDSYAQGCWLNEISGLNYDAVGLLQGAEVGCICGFCVDAALTVHADDVHVVDLHWTRGPWIRLDGRVDVTADHRIITPDGPRLAGTLRAGDRVIAVGGVMHRLRSVERLPPGPVRLGRNVRTASGTFGAGGLMFESEEPRRCEGVPSHREP